MNYKKIIGAFFAIGALTTVSSCGNDSKEKQAPNTIKYVDANGEEVEFVAEKTDDFVEAHKAAEVLYYIQDSNQEIKTKNESYTGYRLESDIYMKMKMKVDGVNTTTKIIAESDLKYDMNTYQFEGDIYTKQVTSAGGYSLTAIIDGTEKGGIVNDEYLILLDGKSSVKMPGYSDKSDVKYYSYYDGSRSMIDSYNLDNAFDNLLNAKDYIITKTTKNTITFGFDKDNFIFPINNPGTNTSEQQVNSNFYDDVIFEVTFDTNTFLPTNIYYEIDSSLVVNGYTTSIEMENNFDISFDVFNVNNTLDTTGYELLPQQV